MVGRDFLDAARHLLAAPSEVNRRAAVGPMCCALLNEARAALDRWGFQSPPPPDLEDFVLSRFDSAPNMDLLRVASLLIRLRDSRTMAENSLTSTGVLADDKEVNRLYWLTHTGIDLLDQIEADPSRRTAAITSIRTSFP